MIRRLSVPSEQLFALAFALARTGLCLYRAATQSLVHDEAFFFNHFLDGPWSRLWSPYDASNHVLYAVLAKCSISLFGLSEFTLRLPSVLAGLVLMLGVFQGLMSCRSWLLRWTIFLALGLHPLLLDFSIAARGYGLSVALLVLAIYAIMRDRVVLGGTFAGLAICANLTAAVPATALAGAQIILMEGSLRSRLRALWKFALPAVLVTLVICYLPLRTAKLASFYVGLDRLSESLLNLILTSIRVSERGGLFGGFNLAPFLAFRLVPLAAAILMIGGVVAWRNNRTDWRRLIVPVTLAGSIVMLLMMHALLGVKYPIDRTGLYIVVLAGLSWGLVADTFRSKVFRFAGILVALVTLAQFASLLQWREFQTWWYDVAVKDAALRLKQETQGRPAGSVSLSINILHYPAIEFYRKYYQIAALQPAARTDRMTLSGYDYYVFNRIDHLPEAGASHVLFTDPVSGIVLAK